MSLNYIGEITLAEYMIANRLAQYINGCDTKCAIMDLNGAIIDGKNISINNIIKNNKIYSQLAKLIKSSRNNSIKRILAKPVQDDGVEIPIYTFNNGTTCACGILVADNDGNPYLYYNTDICSLSIPATQIDSKSDKVIDLSGNIVNEICKTLKDDPLVKAFVNINNYRIFTYGNKSGDDLIGLKYNRYFKQAFDKVHFNTKSLDLLDSYYDVPLVDFDVNLNGMIIKKAVILNNSDTEMSYKEYTDGDTILVLSQSINYFYMSIEMKSEPLIVNGKYMITENIRSFENVGESSKIVNIRRHISDNYKNAAFVGILRTSAGDKSVSNKFYEGYRYLNNKDKNNITKIAKYNSNKELLTYFVDNFIIKEEGFSVQGLQEFNRLLKKTMKNTKNMTYNEKLELIKDYLNRKTQSLKESKTYSKLIYTNQMSKYLDSITKYYNK